jgi:DNA-binding NtrC family response regulator
VKPTTRPRACILVVDDEVSSAQALAALLREEGHEAVVANSREAMTVLADRGCQLLLVDPALSDQTGLRLLSYANELGVSTIVVTSDPTFDPERTRGEGVGFLYKPIRLPTLLAMIAKALRSGGPA